MPRVQYLPPGHKSVQLTVDKPVVAPYVPAGQLVAAPTLARQYDPAGQIVGVAAMAGQK